MEKEPTTWIIPPITVLLPDGSTLVKPGKAIQRATGSRTSKLTGVHRQTLTALADCGLITRERPSPGQVFYYPGEVEDLLKKTRDDPSFWNEVRTKAFLNGTDLKKSHPK
ncbi:MAG: hypothetical protein ABIT37_16305 [Luteolibacter sp.]